MWLKCPWVFIIFDDTLYIEVFKFIQIEGFDGGIRID